MNGALFTGSYTNFSGVENLYLLERGHTVYVVDIKSCNNTLLTPGPSLVFHSLPTFLLSVPHLCQPPVPANGPCCPSWQGSPSIRLQDPPAPPPPAGHVAGPLAQADDDHRGVCGGWVCPAGSC